MPPTSGFNRGYYGSVARGSRFLALHEQKGVAEVIIGKHRNGPTGVVKLTFIGEYTKFVNAAAPRSY